MIRFLTAVLVALLGASVCATLNVLIWMYAASCDPDPTVGGAYAAFALLTSPLAAAFGAIVGGFLGSSR
jgi:hypothetical protein